MIKKFIFYYESEQRNEKLTDARLEPATSGQPYQWSTNLAFTAQQLAVSHSSKILTVAFNSQKP